MNDNFIKNIHDKDFRKSLCANPRKYADQFGYKDLADDVEILVVKNSKGIIYVPIVDVVEDLDLTTLQAAGGTSSSASTAGTVGCVCTTISSAGSVGTAGSAF